MNFKEVEVLLNAGRLDFYNFYDLDIDPTIYETVNYYLNNEEESGLDRNIDLTIGFTDIELYLISDKFDFKTPEHPVTSITFCNNLNNTVYGFFLLEKESDIDNIDNDRIIKQLKDEGYCDDTYSFEFKYYVNEVELIKDYWKKVRALDPYILSGWNSDMFDYPYLYNRLIELIGPEEAAKCISRFGYVEYNKKTNMIQIPEYNIIDLMYLYKPRDEGGLNYGKKQPSYSLDYVSNVELGIKKVEFKEGYNDLNRLYKENKELYFTYNVADCIITKKLNEKLRHIELHNLLRKYMKCSLSRSMIGNSALFESFVYFQLRKENKRVRALLSEEKQKYVSVDELKDVPIPLYKKKKVEPASITRKDYIKTTAKVIGAYVRDTDKKIYKNMKDSIIIDLDATSLYPSIMRQHNISFDVYVKRIIGPECNKIIKTIGYMMDHNDKDYIFSDLYPKLLRGLSDIIEQYIEINSPSQKEDFFRNHYYTFAYIVKKLIKSNINFNELIGGKDPILLTRYFIPLLDMVQSIYPTYNGYNKYCYDYIFKFKGDADQFCDFYDKEDIYVIDDVFSSKVKISKKTARSLVNEIFKNKNLTYTITGTVFMNHKIKTGLFSNMLKEVYNLRKQYKKIRDSFSKDSQEYKIYDSRQNSVKIVMNSTFGVFGLSTYRFSNHWLAHTITISGRMYIKLAQYITDKYMSEVIPRVDHEEYNL